MHGRMQFFQLLAAVAGDGGVADVGVDFAPRGDADGHRFQPLFQMHFISGNHHPPDGHFFPHQFRLERFPLGHEFHLAGNHARSGLFDLRHVVVASMKTAIQAR